MKKSKTFRLEEEAVQKLEEIAKNEDVSQSKVIEDLIKAYGSIDHNDQDTEEERETKSGDSLSDEVLKAFTEQLKVKDKQIETLNETLKGLQEHTKESLKVTNQAQQLQALSESKNIGSAKTKTPGDIPGNIVVKPKKDNIFTRLFGKGK